MDLAISIFLLSIGLIIALIGIAGSILPIIPGPPLSFFSLLIISFEKDWQPFSSNFLIIMGIITLVLVVIDYIIPAIGAKKFGASRMGLVGSIIGMIIGFFIFPPFGIFMGAFLGAIAGELISGKATDKAIKIGIGTFAGNLAGIALKLSFSIFVLFLYIKAIF
ncbi:MAG: DUF456 domain-containing protein [Desulfobacterales bacterium]|nr:DUF456 domain-containing protein [Desulfobacterales bacterium]